jgi:biopolymer transport protein ExbD
MPSPPPNPFPSPIAFDDHILGEHTQHRIRIGRGRARLSLNLTAMIDVVFLLLIYFMVATEFKAGEEIYRLDLPERMASEQERDPFDLDEEPLRVLVTSVGPASSVARIQVEGPWPQPSGFEELHDFLHRRLIGPGSTTGLFEEDHPVVIVPSSATRWEHAIEAFNAAARARYRNINFGKPE